MQNGGSERSRARFSDRFVTIFYQTFRGSARTKFVKTARSHILLLLLWLLLLLLRLLLLLLLMSTRLVNDGSAEDFLVGNEEFSSLDAAVKQHCGIVVAVVAVVVVAVVVVVVFAIVVVVVAAVVVAVAVVIVVVPLLPLYLSLRVVHGRTRSWAHTPRPRNHYTVHYVNYFSSDQEKFEILRFVIRKTVGTMRIVAKFRAERW